MKTITTYIEQIKNATNMVVVDGVISSCAWSFLEDYSKNNPAPSASTGRQQEWIKEATTFFKDDIQNAKRVLIENIPPRFYTSEMYKKLIKQNIN